MAAARQPNPSARPATRTPVSHAELPSSSWRSRLLAAAGVFALAWTAACTASPGAVHTPDRSTHPARTAPRPSTARPEATSQHTRAAVHNHPGTAATAGPLFRNGIGTAHSCTAAVIDSSARNIIVTAAHCVSGTGRGLVFAPGYEKGTAPYGYWIATAAYVPRGWQTRHDPVDDVAFLTVAPDTTKPSTTAIEDVVGGDQIGPARNRSTVTVPGYVDGIDDDPLMCSATTYLTHGIPTFDCPGYANGTSGSPWLTHYNADTGSGIITAIIGGLDAGGCTPQTSYGVPLATASITTALARADADTSGDLVRAPTRAC